MMILIVALSFAAASLAVVSLASAPISSRIRVRRSLKGLSAYEQQPEVDVEDELSLVDRVLWPLLNLVGQKAKGMTGVERLKSLEQSLLLAGVRKLSAEQFNSIKVGLAAAAFILFLIAIMPWLIFSGRSILWGAVFVVLAFYAPDFWLRQRVDQRQRQIGATLADSIDILTIGMEAGLAFDSALAKVAKNMDGPLSEEFGRLLGELQIGVTRSEALRNLANRTNVSELQNFCATVIQADKLGISIGKILRTEAAELRTRRRQRAEEQAMKTPVKLVFPIVLCLLPALMIVILGPAAIRIAGSVLSRM